MILLEYAWKFIGFQGKDLLEIVYKDANEHDFYLRKNTI